MEFRNPAYTPDGRIDMEINHPSYGWIPFTASPADFEDLGRELFALAVSSNPAPYVAPPAPTAAQVLADRRANAELTRAQFCLALYRAQILTAADAISAAKGGWPSAFSGALSGVAGEEAEIVWGAVSTVSRTHPLLATMQAFATLTDAQVDALFGIT